MIALYDDHNNAAATRNRSSTSKPKQKSVTNASHQQNSPPNEQKDAFNQLAPHSGNAILLISGSVSRVLGRVKNGLSQFYTSQKHKRDDRLALQQLLHFNDYLLRDIGLSRSDIVSIKLGSLPLEAEINKRLAARADHDVTTHDMSEHDLAEHNLAEHCLAEQDKQEEPSSPTSVK